ncbi:hypothetical protein AQUCO_04500131v1 [Aquilegia coerulea]|uniref:F-box domain-containing protein n=1 Tax=Aquilegia coerulea TaxID=218851 RepID=A0A2G5CLZ2_AQUCA|nr:hypothetical protein AQUCO_04500131v1 [Aquilegia coerulea]
MGVKQMKNSKISIYNISDLPADILSFILSLLTIKEAARSSILSRRWRYLWKTSVASSLTLNLDVLFLGLIDPPNNEFGDCVAGKFCDGLAHECGRLPQSNLSDHVGFVYQILHLDHSCVKDSFRLRFYVEKEADRIDRWTDMAIAQTKDFAHHIDRWIEIAIAKRCQHFGIVLSHFVIRREIYRDGNLYYPFPCLFSSQEVGLNFMGLKRCSVRSLDSSRFNSLVDLRLKNVHIDGDSIVSILSCCPDLEKLFLYNCYKLLNLKISGRSLKLKHLTILFCLDLEKIEVNAKNLIRLQYCGDCVEFVLVNVPHLSDVIFRTERGGSCGALTYARGKLSSDVPQLESLILSVVPIEEHKICRQLTLFANLKKLVLLVETCRGTLWGFIPLLQASPYLRKFELHLNIWNNKGEEQGLMEKPSDFPHLHLKEITLSGFIGRPHDIEFAAYLLNNATTLERLTIFCKQLFYDPQSTTLYYLSREDVEKLAAKPSLKCKKTAAGVLEQLRNLEPPGIEMLFA